MMYFTIFLWIWSYALSPPLKFVVVLIGRKKLGQCQKFQVTKTLFCFLGDLSGPDMLYIVLE